MTQHAGNSKYGLTQEVTMHANGDVGAGHVVAVDGENSGYPQCTESGTAWDGVAADSASDGEKVDVVVHGDVWVRDSNGASAGNDVGAGDTDTDGILTGTGTTDYKVWRSAQDDADGNQVSLVYMDN